MKDAPDANPQMAFRVNHEMKPSARQLMSKKAHSATNVELDKSSDEGQQPKSDTAELKQAASLLLQFDVGSYVTLYVLSLTNLLFTLFTSVVR